MTKRTAKLLILIGLLVGSVAPARADDQGVCLIIYGLGGQKEYEENFVSWSTKLFEVFKDRFDDVRLIDGRTERRDAIVQALDQASATEAEELWVFLIGHANHTGEDFKFHIKGPDLTGSDLKSGLDKAKANRTMLVAATSASGALLPDLAAENRVVVTATRNARERQPPLFLSFLLEAAESPEADSDKNGRVSLLEAFLYAEGKVDAWFKGKGQLRIEHALLDDGAKFQLGGKENDEDQTPNLATGEGMVSASAYFSTPPEEAYKSLEAKQLAEQRSQLEREVEALKFKKTEMSEAEYFTKLQELLVKMAELSEQIAKLEEEIKQ